MLVEREQYMVLVEMGEKEGMIWTLVIEVWMVLQHWVSISTLKSMLQVVD